MRELTSSVQLENDFTLSMSCKHYIYGPRSKGETHIRIVGPTEDGKFLPQFDPSLGAGIDGLSEAFIALDYVTFFGTKKYSMLAIPPEDGTKAPSAVSIFVKEISEYVNNYPRSCPDEWRVWLGMKAEGQTGPAQRAVLKKPRKHLFVQGYLWKNNGKPAREVNGQLRPRFPVVMYLPPTARNDIVTRLTTPLDDTKELSDTNNRLGNLLGPNGRMLIIEPYDKPIGEGGMTQTWYRCKVDQDTDAYKAPPVPLTVRQNDEVWRPWDSILNLNEDPETTLRRIAATFSPEAVKHAFVEHPYWGQFLPKEFKTSRTDAAKPRQTPARKQEADADYDKEAEEAGFVAEPPRSAPQQQKPKPSSRPPPPPEEAREPASKPGVYEESRAARPGSKVAVYEAPPEENTREVDADEVSESMYSLTDDARDPEPPRKPQQPASTAPVKRVDIAARIKTAMKRFGNEDEEGGDE